MADNDQTNEQPAAQGAEQQGPNFSLQRLYLKDASFESPNSPTHSAADNGDRKSHSISRAKIASCRMIFTR